MTFDQQEHIITLGNTGEALFEGWANSLQLNFIKLTQCRTDYSHFFKQQKKEAVIKRPDYFISLKSAGLIAIDVKHYQLHEHHSAAHFQICVEEVQKLQNFAHLFNLPLWLAFLANNTNQSPWYFFNLCQFEEVTNEPFYCLPVKDAVVVNGELRCPSELTALFKRARFQMPH